MKNNYPTFPNPAGIGSGLGFQAPAQPVQPPLPRPPMFLPMQPHPQITLTPRDGQPDPVLSSNTMYNPQGFHAFNPWGDTSRDGR